MAGPTPTSALIHAATMVTAGVYLIARTHALFALAPVAQWLVGLVGAVTLLMAGCSALTQTDIKRVLAYSTISQIGYMFLALGVGAWTAALFHFMTHAFFKALLFLAAGIVIEALHHEHDIFRMGGLRRSLPIAFWTFLAGGCALAGLPLVTAGFYSKDLILYEAWASAAGGAGFWAAGMIGVVLTSLYTFRLIFLVFFGEPRTAVSRRPGAAMVVPVVVLAVFAVGAGWVNLPPWLGGGEVFAGFMRSALPAVPEARSNPPISEAASSGIAALAFLGGLALAYLFYLRRRGLVAALTATAAGDAIRRWWLADWGFDWLYDRLFVGPTVWLARVGRGDVVDAVVRGIAGVASAGHRALSLTQTGALRWYAAGVAAGTIVFLGIALFL
jgi:NADH-quinone oxidoreductase subunit L